jgi:hypothetical protein
LMKQKRIKKQYCIYFKNNSWSNFGWRRIK